MHSSPLSEQSVHAIPPMPHAGVVLARQPCVASQHPFGHEVALHPQRPVVVSHRCWPGHASHAAPAAPQPAVLWFA
jgi:hypothetical protein